MRKRILIVAAPFGYGPAARALLIADALSGLVDVTFLSRGDALRFIERHRPASAAVVDGVFEVAFPERADLAGFDSFVSVGNEPAVRHLIRQGLALRTIFVDSIVAWRNASAADAFDAEILAYLAQDFPGVEDCVHQCRARHVEVTAPIVWAGRRIVRDPRPAGICLHLGGVTSPLVSWDRVRPSVEIMVERTRALASRSGRTLTVIGSEHLGTLAGADGDSLRIIPQASPIEAAAHVARAEVLVSTPGIGAIYEALELAVPVILLPPMNSTQLHQYGVYTGLGLAGTIAADEFAHLRDAAQSVPWSRQTAFCVAWLARNRAPALAWLAAHLERLLHPGTGEAASGLLLQRQSAMRATFSAVDALERLRVLVA